MRFKNWLCLGIFAKIRKHAVVGPGLRVQLRRAGHPLPQDGPSTHAWPSLWAAVIGGELLLRQAQARVHVDLQEGRNDISEEMSQVNWVGLNRGPRLMQHQR